MPRWTYTLQADPDPRRWPRARGAAPEGNDTQRATLQAALRDAEMLAPTYDDGLVYLHRHTVGRTQTSSAYHLHRGRDGRLRATR